MEVEPGQPLRLNLLQALATATGDKDTALIPMLKAGETTGVHEPIPSSLQWPKKSHHQDFMPLEMCEGNWSAAEAKPSIVQSLIDKEIESGWVRHLPENRTAAQARWPSATAVGKLNLVEAPGKVLDSTVCQVNPNCSLPEAVQLPTVSDVCFSFHVDGSQPGLQSSPQAGQGPGTGPRHAPLSQGQLYGYTVCHFGGLAPAHRTPSACATAPQSLAIRRRPSGSPPPEPRRPPASLASRSSRLSQKPYLLEEGSPGRLPSLARLEVQLPLRDSKPRARQASYPGSTNTSPAGRQEGR